MKKILLLALMLSAAFMAEAQSLTIAPKMQKGDKKMYKTETVTSMSDQDDIAVTVETAYTVADKTADGYVIDIKTTSVSNNADANNTMGRILAISSEMMKDVTVRIATDKNGQLTKVLNYDEVKNKIQAGSQKLVDELFNSAPEIAQLVPKEAMLSQITDAMTEENIINSLKNADSPLALNGKTVMTGAVDEYTNGSNIKMKRTYFVKGNTVMGTSVMNMEKDDIKKLIIAQVEKLVPDQADMIKENIDTVMESGLVKLEANEKSTYELGADGWVKTIKTEQVSNTMGQETKATITVTQM